jgi:hypothetical protein
MWTIQVGYNQKNEAQGNENIKIRGSPENRFHIEISISYKKPAALHKSRKDEADNKHNVEP